MHKLLAFICIGLVALTSVSSQTSCTDGATLRAAFGFTSVVNSPAVVPGLKYCASINTQALCCLASDLNSFQTKTNAIISGLTAKVKARDLVVANVSAAGNPASKIEALATTFTTQVAATSGGFAAFTALAQSAVTAVKAQQAAAAAAKPNEGALVNCLNLAGVKTTDNVAQSLITAFSGLVSAPAPVAASNVTSNMTMNGTNSTNATNATAAAAAAAANAAATLANNTASFVGNLGKVIGTGVVNIPSVVQCFGTAAGFNAAQTSQLSTAINALAVAGGIGQAPAVPLTAAQLAQQLLTCLTSNNITNVTVNNTNTLLNVTNGTNMVQINTTSLAADNGANVMSIKAVLLCFVNAKYITQGQLNGTNYTRLLASASDSSDSSSDSSIVGNIGGLVGQLSNVGNLASSLGSNLGISSAAMTTFQNARKTCVQEIVNIQAAAWCLSCNPAAGSSGYNTSDNAIIMGSDVCGRLQAACYPYLVASQQQNDAVQANNLITTMTAGISALSGSAANAATTLQNAFSASSPPTAGLPSGCTSATNCNWICTTLFNNGVVNEADLAAGGDTTVAVGTSSSRLLSQLTVKLAPAVESGSFRTRQLASGSFNPSDNEAGTTVTFPADPAGVAASFTYSSGVMSYGSVALAMLMVIASLMM